jgi:hypothetical protein
VETERIVAAAAHREDEKIDRAIRPRRFEEYGWGQPRV